MIGLKVEMKTGAQDINGTAIWYSPLVDISSYNMVSLELDAEESIINYLQNTNLKASGKWTKIVVLYQEILPEILEMELFQEHLG